MVILYYLLLTAFIVFFASIVPIGQFIYYRTKKEQIKYIFSEELYNREYKDIDKRVISRISGEYKNFEELKRLEYAKELP